MIKGSRPDDTRTSHRSRHRWTIAWLVLTLLILALAGCGPEPGPGEASPVAGAGAAAETSSTTTAVAEQPASPVPLSPTPTPTSTLAPIPTAAPQPTPTFTPVDDTLVLYTQIVALQTSPDPADLWERHYAFRTLPALPFLDPEVFDALYGKSDNMGDIGNFFFDFRPQISPDGRYLLVPGLVAWPQYDVEGTGTWLIDLEAGEARQLLPDGVIATWSPAGDAITYVKDGVLYTLGIAEGSTPNPLLQDENLWPLYAKWSPDGRTIATLISDNPDPIDYTDPQFFAAVWLVPANGAPARQLPLMEVFGVEYVSEQMSWSPDGQYLLVHNEIYDLEGNLISPDYQSGVHWLPNDTRLLADGDGFRIITIAGEELALISDQPVTEWAFSHDGRYLAYAEGSAGERAGVVVYDIEEGTNRTIVPHSAWPIRWNADDRFLILGTVGGEPSARPQITMVSVAAGSEERLLIDYAELIEAVPYAPPAEKD